MRFRHLILAVFAGALTVATLAPAYADRDDHRHEARRDWHHHDWDRGDYAPPVVVTPPAYYAPPPVYYGSPGISFGITIR